MDQDYIKAHEYEKNVNPSLSQIPFYEKDISQCDLGITFIDFSNVFNVQYKCTTPNLLASFIKLSNEQIIKLNSCKHDINQYNGTSHLFYIIEGSCSITIDNDNTNQAVNKGDILITPCFNSIEIKNISTDQLQIYYINDSPLLNYLGSGANRKIFKTCVYKNDFIIEKLNELSNPNNNRKGILLSNTDTETLGINTITPVLWALYNELPPNTIQKPHKHNSVALDLCVSCTDTESIYTLIGKELDSDGNIINPTKVHWKPGTMFITPPGLWHSHNNIGKTYAYVLPIQDAGLFLYQRILGIVLHKD